MRICVLPVDLFVPDIRDNLPSLLTWNFFLFFIFDFVDVCLCQCTLYLDTYILMWRLSLALIFFFTFLSFMRVSGAFPVNGTFSYNFTAVADGHTLKHHADYYYCYYRYFAFINRLHYYMHNAHTWIWIMPSHQTCEHDCGAYVWIHEYMKILSPQLNDFVHFGT